MRTFRRLAGLALLALAADLPLRAAEPLNFIFILADDMGWTDVGCFGSEFYETPHIDRLAREGMKFTSAYSACTVCSPTRAAVLTGKYPARLHLTDFILGEARPFEKLKEPGWLKYLPLEEVTIAERLKAAGYATAHIGKWHLGDPPHSFGYPANQGFDLTVGGTSSARHLPPHGPLMNLPEQPEGFLTDRLTDAAVKFMEENRSRPFFIYLPHHAPHSPIQGKPEVIEKYRRKNATGLKQNNPTYAALVESVDDSIGKLLATLTRLRLEERTVVVFTTDNGGEVGGENRRAKATDCSPLRRGKGSPYEGGVRVPTMIKWPGVTRPGSVCDVPIISVDYFPTILEMAGQTPGALVDGQSLVPLLRGAPSLPREAIYWHFPHYHSPVDSPYSAVRAGAWKLIHFFQDDRVELYNLEADIGEAKDLSMSQPEKAAELRARLAAWRTSVGAQLPTPNPQYDERRRWEYFRWNPNTLQLKKY
ncbi:MAG: sulfatase [Verrucomicrobia bacterium]|nr:sulfatase [Verrucomicrobiota bacterium]